jgi:hypothetical protein
LLAEGARRGTTLLGLALGLAAVGCVSRSEYDRARTSAEAEREAARHVSARAHAASRRVEALRAKLERARVALEQANLARAQSKLDGQIASKHYQASSEIVTQLREELGRAGGHLRVFSEQKRELAELLEQAEARAKLAAEADRRMDFIAASAREVALSMPELLQAQVLVLSARGGKLFLAARSTDLWLGQEATLSPEGTALVRGLAELAARERDLVFEIGPGARASRATSERRQAFRDTLMAQGVSAARIALVAEDIETPRDVGAPSGSDEEPGAVNAGAGQGSSDLALPDGEAPDFGTGNERLEIALIRAGS